MTTFSLFALPCSARSYLKELEKKMQRLCNKLHSIIALVLLPASKTDEERAFYYKVHTRFDNNNGSANTFSSPDTGRLQALSH